MIITPGHALSFLLIATLAMAAATAEDFPNLVQNPGFDDLDADGWAAGWDIWPAVLPEEGAVSIDRDAPDGRQALRLRHEQGSSYTRAQQVVPVEPGASYFFSCLIRAEDVTPGEGGGAARLYIERPGTAGSVAGPKLNGTFDWRRVTVGPVSFGDVSHVTIMCYLYLAAGTAWFDDVTMIRVTPAWAGRVARERGVRMVQAHADVCLAVARDAGDAVAVGELEALIRGLAPEDMPASPDLRAGPPYSAAEAQMLAIMARLNARRLEGTQGLVAWQADPFAPVSHYGLVPENSGGPATAVMGRGETEQIALNLCNLTPEAMRVRIRLEQDPGGPRLLLREAVHVQTRDERVVADPLPRPGRDDGRGTVVLPPGLIKQVWVMVDSRGVPAGRHTATLDLRSRQAHLQVPLQVEVLPVDFPAETPIVTWNYSYERWPLVQGRWEQARRDLAAHHINAYCWLSDYLPWPTFDADGALQPLDWTRLDQALADHDNIAWLLLLPNFDRPNQRELRLRDETLELGSEEWERRFILWFRAMQDGLRERGFDRDRVAWYVSDEPVSWEKVASVVTAGEIIHKADPQALVTTNPYHQASEDMLRRMDPVVDIWCPELGWATGDLLEFFREGSQILWTYQVLSRASPAFTHYRRSFWDCWDRGITGHGFWCYADMTGSNWDPHDGGRTDYAVVYDGDPDELIPSVRWEAWREGVEDYTYLWMLREATEAGRGTPAQRARARRLLTETAAEVARTGSPDTLSATREQVLRLLAAMQR